MSPSGRRSTSREIQPCRGSPLLAYERHLRQSEPTFRRPADNESTGGQPVGGHHRRVGGII